MTARFFRREMGWEAYRRFADLVPPEGIDPPEPRYNIPPGAWIPVLRTAPHGERRPELALMLWGLVPQWWSQPLSEKKWSSFNARCEEIEEAPTFRGAYRYRRCLVPASGFYVWSGPTGRRTVFALARKDDAPFCFAAVWECWGHDGSEIDTVAILTTGPNDLVAAHGSRMPVMLGEADAHRWMAGGLATPPRRLFAPFPAGDMREWPVSDDVGNVRNQGPELLL